MEKRLCIGEEAYIVAWRVKDMPQPYVESEIRECKECGEDVWVSKVLSAMEVPTLCLGCAGRIISETPVSELQIKVPPEVRKEADEYFRNEVVEL